MLFFTLVTFGRYKFLTSEPARLILRQVWKEVQRKQPFNVEAICLLPEHLHCIWSLPEGDDDYPKRLRSIKGMFFPGVTGKQAEFKDNATIRDEKK